MAALLDAMARLGREDGARVVPAAEDDGAAFSTEECKKAHYALPYFHGLRRESLGCLEMSSQPLEQSLVHLSEALNEEALDIHDKIWAYSTATAFRADLAATVVQKGLQEPQVRDEVYCQLMVMATGNPIQRSVDAVWKLLCACAVTFPPSALLARHVCHFCLDRSRAPAPSHDYARFCLTALEGSLEAGAAYAVAPSVEEMAAYDLRPPVLAKISLVDGTPLAETFPVTPGVDAGKVAEICGRLFLELRDNRTATFGIFVEAPADAGGGTKSPPPRPLARTEYLGDAPAGSTFVYKRLALYGDEPTKSEDAAFEHMTFLQAEDAVVADGSLPVSDADAATLAAFSVVVCLGDDAPTTVDGLAGLDDGISLVEFFPPRFARADPRDLAAAVVRKLPDPATPVRVLHRSYVDVAMRQPLYGAHFFAVRVDPAHPDQSVKAIEAAAVLPADDAILAINARGLSLFHPSDLSTKPLVFVPFGDVRAWERPDLGYVHVRARRDDDPDARFVFAAVEPGADQGITAVLDAYVRPRQDPPIPRTPRPQN